MSSKGKSPAATRGESALVPKLRFPEFLGHPVQDLQLADVTAESTERSGAGQAASQIMGVSKTDGIVPMEDRLIAADTARYKFVRKDWFAYNPMRLNIGSIARWQGVNDILVSPDYVVFKCKSTGPHRLDPGYLDYFRRSDAWDEFVSEKGDGSVRVRIYYKDLARLQLALPSFPEQQKIADCLDSIDTLIAAQARKVEALRAHKKGLMQQLFPQEGETRPCLRFPEFEGAGEWIRSTIGEFKPFVTSGSRGWAAFYADKGDLFIRITNLWRDSIYLDLSDSKFVQLPPDAREGTRTQLKKSDVLISITADIGIIAYVDENVPSPAYINQHIALVRFEEGQLCSKFVAYFLASEGGQRLFRASTDNGTKAGMSLTGIQNIGLLLPLISEQQRIADCLTSLDDLVAAETRKLDTLKTHKKGLMQQLFPAIEESES